MLVKKVTATWLSSVAVVFSIGLISPPAFALLADDEARRAIIDLRTRLEATNNRVAELERSLQNSAQSQIKLLNENERMRSEIAILRGQLEEAARATKSGKSQQNDLYSDLDKRLQAHEARLKQLEPVSVEVNGQRYQVTAAELTRYDALQSAMSTQDFKKSVRLALEFEKEHPSSSLIAEVLFIKGTALYANKELRPSIAARRDFIQRFAQHPSVPQARLNLAASLAETGNPNSARRTLEDLIKLHPKSPEAAEARKRLK